MKTNFLFFCLLEVVFLNVFVQPPGIRGRIIDSESGDPLAGAHVVIRFMQLGQEFARLSGEEGELEFRMVGDGVYSLKITFVGNEE